MGDDTTSHVPGGALKVIGERIDAGARSPFETLTCRSGNEEYNAVKSSVIGKTVGSGVYSQKSDL